MNTERKVGIMVDSGAIESNITHMTDAIRNANFKVVEASGLSPNEDGEYIDAEGDNLIMEEGVVKALLQDAVDSYLVASLPGRNKTDPQEFTYYLWDSFPNVAEFIQKDARVSTYVSSLFASTCGVLAGSLSPALQDIADHGQTLGHIETFHQGPSTSYYLLTGESPDNVDLDPVHNETVKLTPEERREQTKIGLIKELGVVGYEAHIKKEQDLKGAEAFTDYVGVLGKVVDAAIADGSFLKGSNKFKRGFGKYHTDGSNEPTPCQVYTENPHNMTPNDIRLSNEPANLFG